MTKEGEPCHCAEFLVLQASLLESREVCIMLSDFFQRTLKHVTFITELISCLPGVSAEQWHYTNFFICVVS